MKKCSSLYIFLAFAGIIIILLCVVLFAYKPHFAETLSNNNADWGNFGQFFWGLGTMLFTALNVVVLVFVNEQLREYNDLQQEHQDDLKLQIEDNRKQFQMEMLRQKRIDNWLNIYYQIILRLANSNIKSDAEWLSMLRNLTIINRSMISEGIWGDVNNPDHIAYKLEQVNSKIATVVTESDSPGQDTTLLTLFDKNLGLTWSIVQIYFDLTSLKNITKHKG